MIGAPKKNRTVHPLGSNSPSITPKTPSCWMRVGGSVRRGCQQYPPPPASTGATAAMYLRSRPRISSENTENLRPRPRHGSPVTRRHRATQGSGQRYTHLRQGKRGRRTGAVRGPWVIVHLSDLNAWIQPHPRDGPHTIDKHAPVTFLRGGAIAWLRPNSKMVLTERRMMPAPGGGERRNEGKMMKHDLDTVGGRVFQLEGGCRSSLGENTTRAMVDHCGHDEARARRGGVRPGRRTQPPPFATHHPPGRHRGRRRVRAGSTPAGARC